MKFLILGDFCPSLKLKNQLVNSQVNDLFGDFYDVIQKADLSIVNLETPLTSHESKMPKTGPSFKNDSLLASFLKKSGFGLVTLANNHIMDYGPKGLNDTISALKSAGIHYVGAGDSLTNSMKPFIYTSANGKNVAVLNFTENEWSTTNGNFHGAYGFDFISNFNSIKEAKKHSDFVLILTHGGHENCHLPSKSFRNLLRFYIENGADAVVNHHTHCVGGFEYYRGKPIYYSLGNFLFDINSSKKKSWNTGLGVEIDFSKDSIPTRRYFFSQCKKNDIFHLLDGEALEFEQKKIEKLSLIIQNDNVLDLEFQAWQKTQTQYYKINIEPHSNRIIQALQNRKLIPSFWTAKKKMYLLNMLRCESHRETLIKLLKDEISNT